MNLAASTPFFGHERRDVGSACAQPLALVVDGVEHLAVQRRRPGPAPRARRRGAAGRRTAPRGTRPARGGTTTSAGSFFAQASSAGSKRVAVRAAVPEELDHLDLAGGGRPARLAQAHVVRAFDRRRPARARGRGRAAPQAGADRRRRSRGGEFIGGRFEDVGRVAVAAKFRRRELHFCTRTSAASTPDVAELFLARRRHLPSCRTGRRARGRRCGRACSRSVSLALDAQHRQLGALLLGVFGAREGAGLHEVGERIGRRRPWTRPAAPARLAGRGWPARAVAAGRPRGARRRQRPGRRPAARRSRGGSAGAAAAGADGGGSAPGSCRRAALFGSQFRLRSASAASCSAVRCGTLLTNGTGTLVTYSATPSASARPISRPTIRPMTKPPRWRRGLGHAFMRVSGLSVHALGRADAEHAPARCAAPGAWPPAARGARAPARRRRPGSARRA